MNDGHVQLLDTMPTKDLDSAIVQAARVSYSGEGTKSIRSDEGLIRYLMRHNHNTPFEMVEFKFYIKMPIFVARQHFRHRTASVNELSARYSEVPTDFFVPKPYRSQSTVNKQCSDGPIELDSADQEECCRQAFRVYHELIDNGCSRELARCHLPQSTYTEFYWKINLHNLMHYLKLRMASDAQKEIQDYARAIYKCIEPLVPLTMKAFMDFRVNAISLSGPEILAILHKLPLSNKGEQREFEEKKKLLGL
jgi:thymidylate synthase (FAD)